MACPGPASRCSSRKRRRLGSRSARSTVRASRHNATAVLIEQFFDRGLGHASYLVADPDAGLAFLVDPDRQVDAYLAAAARLGVLITDSFETHVHNDYVSGSPGLAELRPITVHAAAVAALEFAHAGHADGDLIAVGELAVRCVATPGHTPEHMAYLV